MVFAIEAHAQERKVEIVLTEISKTSDSSKKNDHFYCNVPAIGIKTVPSDYALPFNLWELSSATENWFDIQGIYNSIQAKVPGITIGNSASINSVPRIRIRGQENTIIILDGVRTDASILANLNPADIEHITIAANAAAAQYLLTH